MEQKVVKTLSNDVKTIRISGQNKGPIDGKDCMYDCHIVEKVVDHYEYLAFTVCYTIVYRITADYYNESWSSSL